MSSKHELQGKVALVTGASSGLGAHFARLLAANGVAVAVAARRTDRLAALVSEIDGAGGKAMAISLDVTRVGQIGPAMDAIADRLGPIDILVNNSGVSAPKPIKDITEDDYDFVLDTNLKGAFFVAQAVANQMIARQCEDGRIINISSTLAHRVIGQVGIYCMSKIAVDQMTKAMALEFARYNINCSAICPGYIETEMNADYWDTPGGQAFLARFPRPRVGEPADLDGALMLLAGPQGRFMNGSIIQVDDGFSVGFK